MVLGGPGAARCIRLIINIGSYTPSTQFALMLLIVQLTKNIPENIKTIQQCRLLQRPH